MSRRLRFPLFAIALVLVGTVGSRSPRAGGQEPKSGELPAGAKMRLGGNRLMFRFLPHFTLLPPDYKTLLVPATGGAVRRFDLATGDPLDKPDAPALSGGQVVVSGDGKRFVTVATGIITIRQVATGEAVQQIRPAQRFSTSFTTGTPSVSLSHDGKLVAQGGTATGAKGAVVVWDVDTNTLLLHLNLPHNGPTIPVLSPDGQYVATRPYQAVFTGKDPTGPVVTVWEVMGGKELFTLRPTGSGSQITGVAFSPDASLIAVSCGDGPIDVWDVKTGKPKHILFGRTGQGVRVAFSPDGKSVAAVATDGSVQRWATADGKLIDTTEGPSALPMAVAQGLAFVTNDRVIVWGIVGQFPVAWEAGKLLTALPEHTFGIRSVGFAAGGKEVITSGQDGRVVRWDTATGKVIGPIELKPSRGLAALAPKPVVTVSADGTRAVSLTVPTAVFDLATGAEEYVVPRGPVAGNSLVSLISADAARVVCLAIPFDQTRPGTCVVWNVADRKKLAEFDVPAGTGPTMAVAFSPDGTRLVTAGYVTNPAGGPHVLRVTGWDLKTGTKLGQVEDIHSRGTPHIAAATNAFAVVATTTGRVRAFDYETGRGDDEIEPAGNRADGFGPIAFSPDGKRFAVGHTTEAGLSGVRIYDWPSGRLLQTFTGHTGPVTALTFAPDGQTLATGSQDNTVLLWDLSVIK